VIHSPSTLAQKYWITNSAIDAKWCVVFAQTIVGKENHGIHGFLVPIRDENMKICKNVRLHDMGAKMVRQAQSSEHAANIREERKRERERG
jgi:acyl-CoA oxidase